MRASIWIMAEGALERLKVGCRWCVFPDVTASFCEMRGCGRCVCGYSSSRDVCALVKSLVLLPRKSRAYNIGEIVLSEYSVRMLRYSAAPLRRFVAVAADAPSRSMVVSKTQLQSAPMRDASIDGRWRR